MQLCLKAGVLAFCLTGTVAAAAGPAEVPRVVAERLSSNPDKCVIYGTVVDGTALPLPDTRVRLRNLQTRAIEQVSATSLKGEFMFVALPEIPYAVEVGDRSGRVLVVSDVMVGRASGATATVLVANASGSYGTLVRGTAGSMVAAAAATGIAVLQSPPPLTPEK